jgi:membrane-anchored glycerophosphoryl diester phosphodiesterase (GDPDase)
MYHPFSVAETIKTAWDVLKKNFITLIVYSMISLFCYKVIKFFTVFIFVYDDMYSTVIVTLVQMLVQSYLVLSFYKLILTLMDREYYEFGFKDIIPSLRMSLSSVTVGLIVAFLVGTFNFCIYRIEKKNESLAQVLYIIETIIFTYLLIRAIFCLCFIVDDDSGPFESIKQSFAITRNNFFKILALIIIVVMSVIILFLILTLLVTFLFDVESSNYVIQLAALCWFAISFPTVQVLIMVTYRKLVYSHRDLDDNVSEAL